MIHQSSITVMKTLSNDCNIQLVGVGRNSVWNRASPIPYILANENPGHEEINKEIKSQVTESGRKQ